MKTFALFLVFLNLLFRFPVCTCTLYFIIRQRTQCCTRKRLGSQHCNVVIDRSKGYHVYVDNYYTSPALLLDLMNDDGFDACVELSGTIKEAYQKKSRP